MTLATNDSRLHSLIIRLQHQAALVRGGGFNPAAEAQGGALADDAQAVNNALRELADLRAQVASFKEGKVDE